MPIPKHDDLRLPALKLLAVNDSLPLKDFEKPLAKEFSLTDDEVSEYYESGNGKIFYDRISWALSYLNMSGLVEKPKRGIYKISKSGLEILNSPDDIHKYIDGKIAKRQKKSSKTENGNTTTEKITFSISDSDQTPQEKLYESFKDIRKSLYQELLQTILNKTPTEFEKLVVILLQAMGYGGEVKNSGIVTQRSNDGGIDGVIKEDILGFGRIHIQAKRYKLDKSIGRADVQGFVGALAVAQSNKGVFITTSYFSKGAIEYADSLNGTTNVILIDGEKLAEYLYDYGIGMQTDQVIHIKKLDADFWDSMKEND